MSDQLKLPSSGQSNQMLSVDKEKDVVPCHGELRHPKIVIENSEDEGQSNQTNATAANMAILPVMLNYIKEDLALETEAAVFKVDKNWYTPIEFKALCSRASSNDWTKSIRFGGRNLETLIDEDILKPHATSCFCAICCDDGSATSPVRLNTSRRRRREDFDGEASSYMHQSDTSRDTSNNDKSENEVVILDKVVLPQVVSMDGLVVKRRIYIKLKMDRMMIICLKN